MASIAAACGDSGSDDEGGANDAGGGSSGTDGGGGEDTGGTSGSSGAGTGGTRGGSGGTSGAGGDPGTTGGVGGEDGGGEAGMGVAGDGAAGMAGAGNGAEDCDDGVDNDLDGVADCSDDDCTLICALGACPAGTSPAVYSASGLPLAIPDDAPENPAVSSIAIPTAGLATKISVQTSITHPYVSDLTLSLVTPNGTRDLSRRNGGGEANYAGTIFSDSAQTAITSGSAPFDGAYRPQQALDVISGTSLSGTFSLRVADDGTNDAGRLTSFSLAVCQCLAASGTCEFGPFACENGIDDDGDGLIDCQEATCASSPSCPAVEHACSDGADNDGDNQVDCDDPSCSWACQTLGSACSGANRLFTYSTRNVPQVIGTDPVILPAPIFAAARGTIVAAAVRFNATHAFVADLDLLLTSPSGTPRGLTSDNGDEGDNYVNTVFVDSAGGVIGTAGYDMAPFTGAFQPEEPLSDWLGQPAAGYWDGQVTDDTSEDGGSFTELSLGLCVAP